uniref:Uncharacterized protein n=1 Tax=Oryza barthii TaxID=65489 RepID=A0A0D3G6T0_9ORYZ
MFVSQPIGGHDEFFYICPTPRDRGVLVIMHGSVAATSPAPVRRRSVAGLTMSIANCYKLGSKSPLRGGGWSLPRRKVVSSRSPPPRRITQGEQEGAPTRSGARTAAAKGSSREQEGAPTRSGPRTAAAKGSSRGRDL